LVGLGLLGRRTESEHAFDFCRCCSHVGPEEEVVVQMDAHNRDGPWNGMAMKREIIWASFCPLVVEQDCRSFTFVNSESPFVEPLYGLKNGVLSAKRVSRLTGMSFV